jgi:CheY-like chemotaxis protein
MVDDHKGWRALVCSILTVEPDLQVVAEASDGLDGVQLAIGLLPDIVLMDVGLPKLNGIQATRRILEDSPGCRILFLTEWHSPDIAQEAMRSGASGYVVKSRAAEELIPAIRAVLAGRVFVSSAVSAPPGAPAIEAAASGDMCRPNPFAEFADSPAIQTFLESVVRASGADFGNVQLFDSTNNVLRIVAHVGFEREFLDYFATVVHENNTVCSSAMAGRERVVANDIAQYPFASRRATDVLLRAQVRSCQSTPLLCGTCGFMGVVSTHYTRPGGPEPEVLSEVDHLTSSFIANICG